MRAICQVHPPRPRAAPVIKCALDKKRIKRRKQRTKGGADLKGPIRVPPLPPSLHARSQLIEIMLTFVRSLKVAHPAHELLVLEVDVVQVKAEIAFRESLKVHSMLKVIFISECVALPLINGSLLLSILLDVEDKFPLSFWICSLQRSEERV